ncbi:MAG: metal ABC transporter solute-binding protein, Zn/Mn family [Candidatus Puniceispirillaceae bacterium]
MMKLIRLCYFAIAAMMVSASPSLAKINVVASFSILGDMVEQVAGDKANVTTIVGPDADAHLYQPNTGDGVAVADADLIITNGMGFETWSTTLIESSGTKAKIAVATDGIAPLLVDGEIDPHAWNSLLNGMIYVTNIEAALSAVSPENAPTFKANADAYRAKLQMLHNHALAEIAKLPQEKRIVVTAHDAFGYLENAYGLTFLAPQGIDTDAEPSAKELAALISFLNETGAGALFVENISNGDLIAQISRETGLTIGGRIYSDALSVKGSPATSYLAMFTHNLELLTATLNAAQ